MNFTSFLSTQLQFKTHSRNISKMVLPREQTGIVLPSLYQAQRENKVQVSWLKCYKDWE